MVSVLQVSKVAGAASQMTGITITGGSGFLAQSIYDHLIQLSLDPVCFKVRYPLSIDAAGPVGKVLIHCAGIAHSNHPDPEVVRNANHLLAFQTAIWARANGYSCFILLSSVLVWDDSLEEVDSVADEPNPNTEYGIAKLSAERDIQKLRDTDFDIVIIRLPLMYGRGVKGNLARLIDAVALWPICPLGTFSARRSITSVQTLSRFVEYLIKKPVTGVFTLIDTPAISTMEMIRMIAEYLPTHGVVAPVPGFVSSLSCALLPSVSKRLFGSRIIRDGTVLGSGFDPVISDEERAIQFRSMVRTRYKQITEKRAT